MHKMALQTPWIHLRQLLCPSYGTQFLSVSMGQATITVCQKSCDLKLAFDLLLSLYAFTDDIRSRFNEFESNALVTVSGNSDDYHLVLARPRKRTRYFDEMKGYRCCLARQGNIPS